MSLSFAERQDGPKPLRVKGPGFHPQCPLTSIFGHHVPPAPSAPLAGGPASQRAVLQPGLQTEESRLHRRRGGATVGMSSRQTCVLL